MPLTMRQTHMGNNMKLTRALIPAVLAGSVMSLAAVSHAADFTRTYDVTASDFVDSSGNLGALQDFNGNYTLTFDPSVDTASPTMAGLTVNANTLPYSTSYTYFTDGNFPDTLTLATKPGTGGPSYGDDDNTYGTFIGGATAATPFSYGVSYDVAGDIYSANVYGVTASPLSPSAVPEPASWLLMIAGIGGIGLMMRRAKTTMGFRFRDALST